MKKLLLAVLFAVSFSILLGSPQEAEAGSFPTIQGIKFDDVNGNGVQDVSEPGLSGWTINLFDDAGTLIDTTITGAGGFYSFLVEGEGTFIVGEVLQAGFVQTFPAPPGVHTVMLILGDEVLGIDFGNVEEQLVGGSLVPIDTTSLLLAGTQMTASWMIPVIVAGIGIAIVIARKFKISLG